MPPKRPTSAAPVKADDSQTLGLKEQTLFKQVLRFYEIKQYKKAIKAADAILAKKPLHGETLAMKGLTMNGLKKKDDAHALVKKGLAMNIKSHICWHVYGLLYRSENKYEDAVKCYQNAIKRNPDDLAILRDMSSLQLQRRMLDGFTESRRKILQLKSSNPQNWVAFAIGNHLLGNYSKALGVLDALQNTEGMGQRAANDKRPPTFDESEMFLYRAMILEEAGKLEECIAYLREKKGWIVDKLHAQEKIAQLLIKLGKMEEAEQEYRQLLAINPENYAYHVGFQKSLGYIPADHPSTKSFLDITYSAEQAAKLLEVYQKDEVFQPKNTWTKVAAVKRLPLHFMPAGPVFRDLLSRYLREKISKGIPSLFSDLEPLYADAEKAKIIEEVLTGFLNHLRKDNKFEEKDEKDSESPSSLMYALYYAAQHYDHINDHKQALSLAEESLAHTPTPPDSYMLMARIYKHAGDVVTAYAYMDTARKMDTQDRYLNTKCVRYALRADQPKQAEETVSLFLRDGDGLNALEELQAMWYTNSFAEHYMRVGNYGRALKKLLAIDKHFTDIYEDQFDFHNYCLRKTTLRAYITTLRWGNSVRQHRFHVRAAINLVQIYLHLHDAPLEEARDFEERALEANMSEEEKKFEAKKLKKAAAKAKAAEAKAAEAASTKNPHAKADEKDADPEGAELLKTEQPLEEATKFLRHLTNLHASSLITHILAVSLYIRKQKWLLALKHTLKAIELAPTHPDTHFAKCTFLLAIRKEGVMEAMHPIVKEVMQEHISGPAFGSDASVSSLNTSYLSSHSSSLSARLSVAKVMLEMDRSAASKKAAAELAAKVDANESFTRQEATDALTFLAEKLRVSEDVLSSFKKVALQKYPYALAFGAVASPPPAIDAPEQQQA